MPKKHSFLMHVLLAAILSGGMFNGRCDTDAGPITISPDDSTSIQRGIDLAYQSGLHRIVIPPGTYRLSMGPRAGLHLLFSKMKNFEIDATGVTLVFTTRDKPSIRFDHCENVTFRGATLLRDPIPFSQGKVISISPDGRAVDLRVSKGYPADFDDKRYYPKLDNIHRYNPKTRQWEAEVYARAEIERLGPDSFRFHGDRILKAESGWIPGVSVAWRGWGAPDIELLGCQGMKTVGVTIMNGTGFCVFENGGGGGNYYNYTLTYGPKPEGATEEPLMSSNADAFHSNQMRKGPTMEDCHFEGMNDDGIPIHGTYALAISSEGNQAIIQVRYPPFCQPGDHLRLWDERFAAGGDATVVSIEPMPGYKLDASSPPILVPRFRDIVNPKYFKVTLDHPIDAKFGWFVGNADTTGNGFVIRRCTVRNNRARGMLIKASDGLIEDCTVEGSSIAGIVLSPEIGWVEADYSSNVIVRHNTIRGVGYWKHPESAQAGAVTVAAAAYGCYVPLPGGHRNIVIEDNTFENDDGPNILISSAQDVVIRNNHFIHPLWKPSEHGKKLGVNNEALVWLTECTGVQLMGNLVSDPGPYLKKFVVPTATATGTGFDDGIVLQR